jgi:branched-chain amino acid transport system ATP-binding protein
VPEPLLRITGLTKRYGGLAANTNIDLDVCAAEVHAIIGPNGAGKTTFVQQIAGESQPTSGMIRFQGNDVTRLPAYARARLGLARSFQITSIFSSFTVRENVAFAAQTRAGHSFRFWKQARDVGALNARAEAMLDIVGLGTRADDIAVNLSHGEHRQLEIAMALAVDPVMLLLDEPTAGMGREESLSFVATLRKAKGDCAIILVEHDMDVVFALADRITVLADGKVIASDVPDVIRTDAAVRSAYLGEAQPT